MDDFVSAVNKGSVQSTGETNKYAVNFQDLKKDQGEPVYNMGSLASLNISANKTQL